MRRSGAECLPKVEVQWKIFCLEIIPVTITGTLEAWSEPKNNGIEGLKRYRNGEAN